MPDIVKLQDGNMIAALPEKKVLNPLAPADVAEPTTAIAPVNKPLDKRPDIPGLLKVFSEYTKAAKAFPVYNEDSYRGDVKSSFDKYNNKPVANFFTPAQKANVEKLKIQTSGDHVPLCIAGSCKVLQGAGDSFTGKDSVDGIYFGNETAAAHLKEDGFIPATDPNNLKRGDILQIMMNKDGRNYPQHGMLFDSYIKDKAGKVVGARMFENHGDGVEKYVSMTNDPQYVQPGDDTSTFDFMGATQNFNPTKPLNNQAGIQAWTKSPEALKKLIDQKNQERASYLDPLQKKLTEFDPQFADINRARSILTQLNHELPKPQQQRIYADGGEIEMDELERKEITVEGKTYKVMIADTPELRETGLQGVTDLEDDEGMLFIFDGPTDVAFWMKDTLIPLDIIYIDQWGEVKSIHQGSPEDEEQYPGHNIMYVLEVVAGSSIKVGDDVDLSGIEEDDDDYKLHVVHPNGDTQMELKGGERIFSRVNTKALVKLSKRAYKSEDESDYKALGRRVFKYLKIQDNKENDYVELPTN